MSHFKPLLAGTVDIESGDLNKIVFPVIASPKIDGIRIFGFEKLYTRTLKPVGNKFLQDFYKNIIKDRKDINSLDGEITVGSPLNSSAKDVFNKTQTAVMAEDSTLPCTYWVFDTNIFSQESYQDRLDTVIKHVISFGETENQPIHLKILPYLLCYTIEQILQYEQIVLNMGFEGLMLRSPSQKYKFGRSSINPKQQHLLKLKRFTDAEAEIIGFEELMNNNNKAELDNFGYTKRSASNENLSPANTLGALIVRCVNGDYKGVEFNIGTGFDAELRLLIWDNKDNFLGKQLTFKYQECGTKNKPRIPVFKSFRENL